MVEDDLFFAQRVRAAAARLAVPIEGISLQQAQQRTWAEDNVVVLQATLNSARQLALVEQLAGRSPAPLVIAVTGHLETALRRRAKAAGALLASHSSMDRIIGRALARQAGG